MQVGNSAECNPDAPSEQIILMVRQLHVNWSGRIVADQLVSLDMGAFVGDQQLQYAFRGQHGISDLQYLGLLPAAELQRLPRQVEQVIEQVLFYSHPSQPVQRVNSSQGELKVAMDWRKIITGAVGIRRRQPAQLGQLEPRDISGTNGQSTILHWPLTCPANGVHLTRLNCPPSPCGRLPGSYLDLPAKSSRFSLIRPTMLGDTWYG